MGIRGQALAVLLGAVVAAAAVAVVQAAQDEVYEASSLVEVDPAPSTVASAGGRPENIVFLTRTYAARAATRPVADVAVDRAGLSLSVDEALERLTVEVSNADATVSVRTTGPSQQEAEALNTAFVEVLAETVQQEQEDLRGERLAPVQQELISLEKRLPLLAAGSPQRTAAEQQFVALVAARAEAQLQPVDRISVLSPAEARETPVAPRPVRAGLLTLLIALVVGAQVLVGLHYLRRSRPATTPSQPAPRPTDAPLVVPAGPAAPTPRPDPTPRPYGA